MIKKYLLLAPRFEHPAGRIVYKFQGYDYGLARDDEEFTGIPHLSLTTDPLGVATPFFTVSVTDIMELN